MRYADILNVLKEGYETDLKRQLRDALVQLKIQGVTEVPPQKIMDDFKARGIEIGLPDVINLLQNDPMIKDVNKYKITFNTDQPDEKETTDKEAENSEKTVDQMARQALNKRMIRNKLFKACVHDKGLICSGRGKNVREN